MTSAFARHASTVIAAAAVTAAVVAFAPGAGAAPTIVTVNAGNTIGGIGTGCPVTITAHLDPYSNTSGEWANFYDNGTYIGQAGEPHGGKADLDFVWTFTATGTHVIRADTFTGRPPYPSSGSITVTVTTGVKVGSVCFALPY